MTTEVNYTAIDACLTRNTYWKSIEILLQKPHVVNKRLWGGKILCRSICKCSTFNWDLSRRYERLQNIDRIDLYKSNLLHELQLEECPEPVTECSNLLEIILVELLPKAYTENHAYQLIFLVKENGLTKFCDITPKNLDQNLCPNFPYSLQLVEDRLTLNAYCDIDSKSYEWLKNTVLPQFIKWAVPGDSRDKRINICSESLTLISNDKYYTKYNDLKNKYGKEMVKIWPECTDPSKYVYEDVAIATYLLLLWEDERDHLKLKALQTFVDLGCGNGLLVYILTKEEHLGVGIDVRKRQIWDMFTSDIKLEEKTITPSDSNLFSETDWIIGNHSDELTPWIPVIAARSSYNCNFFLLPCCAFNFDGSKYQRQNSSVSQYTEYLQYIKQLCEDCGIKTKTDRLKIPSTKRICLVGRGRTYPKEEYVTYCHKIQDIIHKTSIPANNDNEMSWLKDFKARDPVERVRNCTQIDKTLIENIVETISNYLLEECSLESNWTLGRTVELSEVVQLISQDKLKALKSECGGLQTLLRNNHHIFKVQNGKVQLRHPKSIEEVSVGMKNNKNKALMKIQQKPCWFYNYHPQGCPLQDTSCSFLHVKC